MIRCQHFTVSVCAVLFCTAAIAGSLPGEDAFEARLRGLYALQSPARNPSFIAEENFISLRCAISSRLNDFNTYEFGGVLPLGIRHTVAANWLSLDSRPFTGYHSPSDTAIVRGRGAADKTNRFILAYAFNIRSVITAGAALHLDREPLIAGRSSSGMGIDIGLSYPVVRSERLGNHTLGLALQNLLAPDPVFTGEYPRNLRLSLSSDIWDRRLAVSGEAVLHDAFGRYNRNPQRTGPDYFTRMWTAGATLTGEPLPQLRVSALAGSDLSGQGYWSLGATFTLKVLSVDHDLTIGYQNLQVPADGVYAQTVSARLELGKARLTEDDLYAMAMELLITRRWAYAYFALGRVSAEFPNSNRTDLIRSHMGTCAERLFLPDVAEYEYRATIDQFPGGRAAAGAQAGLVSLACARGDTAQITTEYRRLMALPGNDSLRMHAAYRIAQERLSRQDFSGAAALLENITEDHPAYPYAQYSLGIALYARQRHSDAAQCLDRCALFTANTPDEELLSDMACVTLGALYYEQAGAVDGATAKGVSILRAVNRGSPYYPYALLMQGWMLLRAGKWSQCANVADSLLNISAGRPAAPEAFLLKSYGMLMMKDYAGVIDLLKKMYPAWIASDSAAVNSLNAMPTPDTLKAPDEQTGSLMRQLAFSSGWQRSARKIDETATALDARTRSENARLAGNDRLAMDRLILRPFGDVDEDIQYVLAKAMFMRDKQKRTGH